MQYKRLIWSLFSLRWTTRTRIGSTCLCRTISARSILASTSHIISTIITTRPHYFRTQRTTSTRKTISSTLKVCSKGSTLLLANKLPRMVSSPISRLELTMAALRKTRSLMRLWRLQKTIILLVIIKMEQHRTMHRRLWGWNREGHNRTMVEQRLRTGKMAARKI